LQRAKPLPPLFVPCGKINKMENSMELDDKLYDQLVGLIEEGDELLSEGEIDNAISKYNTALALLPDPKFEWEASTYIYTALGDSYFIQLKFEDALTVFQCAFKSVDGEDNPYICLMLGETYYELNDKEKAKDYLLQAYELEGEDIFEDEDVKYFELIKSSIQE
jgi:tetratricopeptide (TPR) repeat protein